MTQYDFDLFVIGGGSGGVRASRIAASLGARVGVAEERYMGGTCVNVGCIPKKLLAYSAGFGHGFDDSAGYGWNCDGNKFSWPDLIRNKDAEIFRLNGIYRRVMESAGVKVRDARGVLADAHTVELSSGERVTADRILIATGGWPKVPEIPGRELAITSNEAFHLPDLPPRVLIVGGGYIAVEFAGIFQGLGAQVTLIHRGMAILTAFDHELGATLMHEMYMHGVKVHLHSVIKRLEKIEGGIRVICNDDQMFEVDCVLYATGRAPMSHGIGLEALGVALDADGAVIVDDEDRTNIPNIYAVGDVTNQLNLTPVATAKGHALAERLYAGGNRHISMENVATAIFSSPPIATVGLSEEQAVEKGIVFDVYKQSFRPLKHRLSMRDQQTFMKLIVDRASDKVLGCHVIGDDAAEMMQGFAVALTAGATKAMFDRTIGIHPTSAEEFLTMRAPVQIQP
ncbi:MAG: gor [Rhodospirillales bacterium]|nr:gor [Rhodospirillales bacterium]